ncbi:MAG: hypothetical protein KAR20_05970 [Candidatus Heimdallarchaeota archaeon]|nr:hypothetical protein [Candidatus Heimdallarchaeota archaeon]
MGRIDRWLTSDAFELNHAYSIDAENTIKEAIELQKSDAPSRDQIERISDKLMKYLPSEDPFWPRWVCYAERYGVDL